jgi:hypothetical protein
METIVHFGMPKTGTTTLQRTLTLNAARLLRSGIFYPVNLASSSINHRILAFYAMDPGSYPRHMHQFASLERSTQCIEELQAVIAKGVARHRPSHLVLSAESLFTVIRKHKQSLYRQYLLSLGESLRFVAYLRSPAEAYLSVCQQKLKASQCLKSIAPPQYKNVVASYRNLFADCPIHLLPFERDRFAGGDIVRDFCERHLAATRLNVDRLTRKQDSNTSLSAEAMAVIKQYRRKFCADQDDIHTQGSKKLIRHLREADHALGAARPRLRDDVRSQLQAQAAPDLLWLRDHYSIQFSQCDYDALAAPQSLRSRFSGSCEPRFLHEIVHLDASAFRNLIDYLADQRFVRRSSDLLAWLAELSQSSLSSL